MKRELEGEAIASRVDEIALLRAENVALKKQVAYLRSQRLTRLNEVKLAREYAEWARERFWDDCSIGRSLLFTGNHLARLTRYVPIRRLQNWVIVDEWS